MTPLTFGMPHWLVIMVYWWLVINIAVAAGAYWRSR